jgi:hypothetical protein
MNDLITWLRAQLDDDERVARAASTAPWLRDEANASIRHSGPSASKSSESFGMYVIASVGAHDIGRPSHEDAEHIARWDPARVLAEVDAKRRILDELWDVLRTASHYTTVESCDELDAILAERVLRRLALPYAERSGYDERWRP